MRWLSTALAEVTALMLANANARATSEYNYKQDEYVFIHDGLAPGKQFSIAAHSEGEGGNDNFHLYLMAEPAHTVIALLENIGSDTILGHRPGRLSRALVAGLEACRRPVPQ